MQSAPRAYVNFFRAVLAARRGREDRVAAGDEAFLVGGAGAVAAPEGPHRLDGLLLLCPEAVLAGHVLQGLAIPVLAVARQHGPVGQDKDVAHERLLALQ